MLSNIPHVESYRGFASDSRLIYSCRLLSNTNGNAYQGDRLWQNIKNTIRKAVSNEIPGGKVQIDYGATSKVVLSDDEGYVFIDWEVKTKQSEIQQWNSIIINDKYKSNTGEILVPSTNAKYGIISDIDDTVIVTDVHSPFKMMINSLLKNPFQRKAFDKMDLFFNKLHDNKVNPVFYLSNSPWNLYKNIEQFLMIHNMPIGPILLRDYGFHFPSVPHSYSNHKEINIELILSVFPNLPFVLIGDASQEDAIIYNHIKQKYPSRIKEIYIREVADQNKMKDLRSNSNIQVKDINFFKDYKELI